MLGSLLRIGAALALILQVASAEAAQRRASKARATRALTNEHSTTHISKGLFAGWIPPPDVADVATDPPDPEPPLNHMLPDSGNRFANDLKTKAGWTSTFGLLPQPESKLSLPSPDVRLQERGIHLGAAYRF